MGRKLQKPSPQGLLPLLPLPPHGHGNNVRKSRNNPRPNPTQNQNPKLNRMHPVHTGRMDSPQFLPRTGLPIQFILTLSLFRPFPTTASHRHVFPRQHHTSWGLPVDSYKIIVCHLGVITRDVRFIHNDDIVSFRFFLMGGRYRELHSPYVTRSHHV